MLSGDLFFCFKNPHQIVVGKGRGRNVAISAKDSATILLVFTIQIAIRFLEVDVDKGEGGDN